MGDDREDLPPLDFSDDWAAIRRLTKQMERKFSRGLWAANARPGAQRVRRLLRPRRRFVRGRRSRRAACRARRCGADEPPGSHRRCPQCARQCRNKSSEELSSAHTVGDGDVR